MVRGTCGRHRVFVAVYDGDVIGYASSGTYRAKAAYEMTVETSVYVALEFVGRGVGASLYSVLLDALEREDVHRAARRDGTAERGVRNPSSSARLRTRRPLQRAGALVESNSQRKVWTGIKPAGTDPHGGTGGTPRR